MKKINFIITALFLAMLTSCSSGHDTKEISPTTTEFAEGELAKYIEVVDKPYELTYDEKLGDREKGICMKVTLRLKKDGFKNVELSDIEVYGDFLSVELIDKNGMSVGSLCANNEHLQRLLKGSKGDTQEIFFKAFETGFWSVDDVLEVFKKSSQFTPKRLCNYRIRSSEATEEASKDSPSLDLNSTSSLDINTSSSSSEDWDQFLASYERFVNKYIALYKKAQAGDMSALTEYTSLLQEAQEVAEKIEGNKSSLTPSQWARYEKITMKMATAAAQ